MARDTIYDYDLYYSIAHEALGISAGTAALALGGPGARTVLPVGTGHCRTRASDDFLVFGACPEGQDWDICREAPPPEVRAPIERFPVPVHDQVTADRSHYNGSTARALIELELLLQRVGPLRRFGLAEISRDRPVLRG